MHTRSASTQFDWRLLAGDALALLVVVIIGLRFHGESSLARLPFTFLPWLLAWILAGLPLGLFASEQPALGALAGRTLWAMALASPLAGVLRAAWLGTGALPVFVLVMGLLSTVAIFVWRAIYGWLRR